MVLAGTGAGAGKEMKIYRSFDNGETFNVVLDLTKLDSSLKIVRSFTVAKNGTVYVALDCSYASKYGMMDDAPNENKNS